MKELSEKMLATEELEDFSILTITEAGSRFWTNKIGQAHREEGPASEYYNGDKTWMQNGIYHREDGPAQEYIGGSKYYYLNGKQVSEAKVKALGKIK